jgi:hypothetical protein
MKRWSFWAVKNLLFVVLMMPTMMMPTMDG